LLVQGNHQKIKTKTGLESGIGLGFKSGTEGGTGGRTDLEGERERDVILSGLTGAFQSQGSVVVSVRLGAGVLVTGVTGFTLVGHNGLVLASLGG